MSREQSQGSIRAIRLFRDCTFEYPVLCLLACFDDVFDMPMVFFFFEGVVFALFALIALFGFAVGLIDAGHL